MRTTVRALAPTMILLLLVGCSTGPTAEKTTVRTESVSTATEAATDRTIALTKGDSLSVSVGADESVEIRATILAGKPNAGTYTSQDAELLELSRAAKNALGDPNVVVSVTVNAGGEIIGVSYSVTL